MAPFPLAALLAPVVPVVVLGSLPAALQGEFEGPVRAFTIDPATGAVTHALPAELGADTAVPDAFDNASCDTGFWGSPAPGRAWMDFGVKATGLSGIVSGMTVGYVTTVLDPGAGGPGARFGFEVRAGATGFGDPGTLVRSFSFASLPGSPDGVTPTAYAMQVDLTTQALCVPDGPLGWCHVEAGDTGRTGPILATVGGCPSGTIDAVDRYLGPADPTTYVDSFAFARAGISSFSFALTEDDGSVAASATFRNTTNPPDYLVDTPPTVCGMLEATILLDPLAPPVSFLVLGVPDLVGSPNPFGAGDLLVAAVPPPLYLVGAGAHSVPVPPNVTLIGKSLATQGFRAGATIGTVDALNAFDLVIGT